LEIEFVVELVHDRNSFSMCLCVCVLLTKEPQGDAFSV
jgi:hypothetical protein